MAAQTGHEMQWSVPQSSIAATKEKISAVHELREIRPAQERRIANPPQVNNQVNNLPHTHAAKIFVGCTTA
jgi:hypothetical protein